MFLYQNFKLVNPDIMWYVYILRCCNGEIYKGCTNNLANRLERHAKGWVDATCKILPVTLIMYVAFLDKYKAFQFEKYLKSGSGRAFMKKHFI